MPIDLNVLKNALPSLERDLRHVREDLGELANREWQSLNGGNDEAEEGDGEGDDSTDWIGQRMESRLVSLARFLCVVLDAIDLPSVKQRFVDEWRLHEGNLKETKWYFEVDVLHSAPVELVDDYVEILRGLSGTGLTRTEQASLSRVEGILQSLPYLIARRGVQIAKEEDIQVIFDEAMSLAFPEGYERKPPVGGILKTFIADGGVRSEGILVELKFARDAKDFRRCIDELAADISGYRGSADWRNLYIAIVMDGPFVPPLQLQAELARMGAENWRGYALHLASPGTAAQPAPSLSVLPAKAPVATAASAPDPTSA
ncbi:MAG: hypothetical protein ACOZQL_41590 [Myxococcota bacterium]